MTNIWSRKSLTDLTEEAAVGDGPEGNVTHLRRSLSALNLVALGVGGIVGAGIFVLTGHAAAANAGPAITLSFVLGVVACAFAGLCYAEMASAVPVAGSAYTYAYATIGEMVAWIIGWDLILEYAVGAVTVAIGWCGCFTSLLANFGILLPKQLVSAPFAYDAASRTWSTTGAILNVPAMAIIAAISALLVVGIQESARFNVAIVAIKLTVIAIFIIFAAPMVDTSHWVTSGNPNGSFIPPNAGIGIFGLSGVVRGAAVVFFAFIGCDAVSTAAQEAKNPSGTCPSAYWAHWQSVLCSTLPSHLSSPVSSHMTSSMCLILLQSASMPRDWFGYRQS
jgi:APA family basic amino acid/polyamine antiporter